MTGPVKAIGSSAGNPSPEGRPPSNLNDQLHIMQSLMEIQRELTVLSTKADRLISDVGKLDDQMDKVRGKISRFEGVGIGAVLIFTLLGGFIWWLIGGQITQLRDQIYEYRQEVSATPAPPKSPTP
jgi:hypothetical protein